MNLHEVHPRILPVAKALSEAEGWLLQWSERHDLTAAEVLAMHAKCVSSILNAAIVAERKEAEGESDAERIRRKIREREAA